MTTRLILWGVAICVSSCGKNHNEPITPPDTKAKVFLSTSVVSNAPTTSMTNSYHLGGEATASVQLGHSIEGTGLRPAHTRGDGECFPSVLEGVECYQLVRKERRRGGYLYIKIPEELKNTPFVSATIVVQYFDDEPDKPTAGLTIEYDAMEEPYKRLEDITLLTGSKTWKQAVFRISDPRFGGRQNGGADFRICALAPDFFVRSVAVVKNAAKATAQ